MSLCLEELAAVGGHGVIFTIDMVEAVVEGGDPSLVANGAQELKEALEKLQECAEHQNFIERAAMIMTAIELIALAVLL